MIQGLVQLFIFQALGDLVSKSVTAPMAMGIAERVQASPTLTAIFAVSTGILGSVLIPDAVAWWY